MSNNMSVFIVISIIWSLIGLGLLVWYLWAMARLFPKLGLNSWEGWIPVWNQWRLIDRAGLPGWVVLLGFVGLGVVPLVFLIIAMHRVNAEAGLGAGYTVLGVFIPPLWATLLAGVIGPRVLHSPYEGAKDPGYANPGYARTAIAAPPSSASPPLASTSPATTPLAPAPAAGGAGAPAAAPPWLPPVPPQAAAPGAQPASDPAASRSPLGPPSPSGPLVPPSQLGAETDAEYARLAAESFAAPPAAPLGAQEVPEPFSWTAASRDEPPAPPAPAAPPLHPVAQRHTAQPPVAQPHIAQPPAAPAPVAQPPAAQTPVAPSPATLPPAPALSESSTGSPWAPVPASAPASAPSTSESAPEPISARGKATGITGAFPPLLIDGSDSSGGAPSGSADPEDPLDDRTVVVSRRRIVGQLVLSNGERYELASDVIVGRRPAPAEGAALLPIADPTRTLSKSHARLRFDGERWTVEDLGSTNGVVLLHEGGPEEEIEPHREVDATKRMLFGTLEVILRTGGDPA